MEQTQTAGANETLVNLNGSEVKAINAVIDRIMEHGGTGYASHLMNVVAGYAETIRMIRALSEDPTEQEVQELKEWANADLNSLLEELWIIGSTIHLFDECDTLLRSCRSLRV